MAGFTRRRFLTSIALSAPGWALARSGIAAQTGAHHGHHGLATPPVAPQRSDRFTQPLRVPGDSGMFGLFEPGGRFELRARPLELSLVPGTRTPLWLYQVTQGGRTWLNPVFVVRRGAAFDSVFANALQEASIIHWHGLLVADKDDGHPRDTAAGGASYPYRFKVPNRSAMYWYHPHPHGRTAAQVYAGLAGVFIVQDEEELALRAALDLALGTTDVPLVLQDRRMGEAGRLDYRPSDEERFGGLLGDTILVNATPFPDFEAATRPCRFRLLNGSNARVYRLAFVHGSSPIPFSVVGSDGGLLDAPVQARELFLSPGERGDLLLDLRNAKPGDELFLHSLAFDPMHRESGDGGHAGHGAPGPLPDGAEFDIMRIAIRRETPYDRPVPGRLSRVLPIPTAGAPPRSFELHQRGGRWRINDQSFDMNKASFSVRRGAREIWECANSERSMPHPMHVHGFHFQVLERLGSPAQVQRLAVDAAGCTAADLGWKDTVLVWPGETVRVALDFTHPHPGEQTYLLHCHNLEHEDEGMMVNFRVVP
jgi:blue copper oxidase